MMKRPGLRALYIGFGLVIALLATASVMGTRMATEIHDDALRLREALNSNHTAAGRPAIELQQEIAGGKPSRRRRRSFDGSADECPVSARR